MSGRPVARREGLGLLEGHLPEVVGSGVFAWRAEMVVVPVGRACGVRGGANMLGRLFRKHGPETPGSRRKRVSRVISLQSHWGRALIRSL